MLNYRTSFVVYIFSGCHRIFLFVRYFTLASTPYLHSHKNENGRQTFVTSRCGIEAIFTGALATVGTKLKDKKGIKQFTLRREEI